MLSLTLEKKPQVTKECTLTKKVFFIKRKKRTPDELKSEFLPLVGQMKKHDTKIVAANEVGISQRVIYIDAKTAREFGIGNAEVVLLNPVIIKSEGLAKSKEETIINGESQISTVIRPYKITVAYHTIEGDNAQIELNGINASLFCQRYHLLDGVLPQDIDEYSQRKSPRSEASTSVEDDYTVETETGDNVLEITYRIENMGKGCCTANLENDLKKIPGIFDISINLVLRTVKVSVSSTLMTESPSILGKNSLIAQIENMVSSFDEHGTKYEISKTTYKLKTANDQKTRDVVSVVLRGRTPRSRILASEEQPGIGYVARRLTPDKHN